jgi:hypothetical protein
MISRLRHHLYRAARFLGDVNAVRRGRIRQRIENRLIGRLIFRLFRRL